ncbi:xlr-like isoform X2 [Mus musculus]|uniref:xlr-like isoform X2 n=1 Tax=Mus musculus TaxID=10090 RepID=UPI0005ABB12B|nr:xlr-like isoform X2 [Mus musculus]|eukprot:XP_011245979.1 PREDICTED: xlr-like isoform X2 [Mus musculus]
MALKKLWSIPKEGYLLLLDCDDEEDDINFLEEAHSEENLSFSVEWQRFARSVETPMENRNLLSGEQQDGNASELDLMEEQNPVTHDDENANPEEVVGDTRKKINNKFCEQYITTFQKFDMDVQKFNEEQEKSVGLMNLETNNYNVLFDVDGELRKEMSVFKKDLMKHTLKYSSTFPSSD